MSGKIEIYVFPWELWDYVNHNRHMIMRNLVVIAENKSAGVEITVDLEEEDDFPIVSVYLKGELSVDETIVSAEDALVSLRRIYDCYLNCPAETGQPPPEAEDEEEDDDEPDDAVDADEMDDDEYEAYKRREDISDAFRDFLNTVLGNEAGSVTEQEFQRLLEYELQNIAACGYLVYAPEIVNGKWVEYPYND